MSLTRLIYAMRLNASTSNYDIRSDGRCDVRCDVSIPCTLRCAPLYPAIVPADQPAVIVAEMISRKRCHPGGRKRSHPASYRAALRWDWKSSGEIARGQGGRRRLPSWIRGARGGGSSGVHCGVGPWTPHFEHLRYLANVGQPVPLRLYISHALSSEGMNIMHRPHTLHVTSIVPPFLATSDKSRIGPTIAAP